MTSRDQSFRYDVSTLLGSCPHLSPSTSFDQLTKLSLANLQLVKIDRFPFERFPNLRSLDLSRNQLVSIDAQWANASPNILEHLDLSHNKLETLSFLRDLKLLKTLNVTANALRTDERCLSLYICPTIEQLIDGDEEQIHHDRMKLKQLCTIIEQFWSSCYLVGYPQGTSIENLDEFRQAMFRHLETHPTFSDFSRSSLAKDLLEEKFHHLCGQSKTDLKMSLADHFHRSVTMSDESQSSFQPVKFLHAHHQSSSDLTTIPVHMCAFEPGTADSILATCGGRKVCFVDCQTCEITHLLEVPTLPSTVAPAGRKTKDKSKTTGSEHFSCLCWMEIKANGEYLKVLAVGATNGSIYLILPRSKLMFGHIQLPGSSIGCITWHASDPFMLVIGSFHTVRFINVRSYIDRVQSFIRKRSESTSQFDYVDSSMFINKVPTTHIYNLYEGAGPLMTVTDLLFCPISNVRTVLLVGTTSGLFIIKYQEKSTEPPIQLALPKSIWTVSTHVVSMRPIAGPTCLIAMNILNLDQICCFDLERSLEHQQLHIILSYPNPYRQMATKLAIFPQHTSSITSLCFECIIGGDHGSFSHYRIPSQPSAVNHYQMGISPSSPAILSAALNAQYLCLTTNSNLICVYKRY